MRVGSLSIEALLLAVTTSPSCLPDPVHQEQVDALGPETIGVPAGPLHRPGQPCSACHGGDGPAATSFSLAGTVYEDPARTVPLSGASVRFIDWTGAQFVATTNCAGNFYVSGGDYTPLWPVWTKVEYGGETAEMISAAFRETSCNACHADPAGPTSVGHVYLAQSATPVPPPPEAGCP